MNLETPCIFLICAEPNSGKSHLIRYQMYQMALEGKFDYGLVLSASADLNSDYDYIDKKYIHSSYSDELILDLMKHQRENPTSQAFFICDDIIGEAEFDSKPFKKLESMYRHLRITIFISVQYLNKATSPLLRNCATYFAWFRTTQLRSLKAIHESFGMRFESEKEFIRYCNKIEKYEFVFYNKRTNGNSIEECYKKFIAPKTIPKFFLEY